MAYREIAPFPKQMTIVIGLCVVAAMAFGLAISFYNNILFDKRLANMANQNDKLRSEIIAGYKQLDYLRSDQYKDKYAKQNLNRVNYGEKAIQFITDEDPLTYVKPDRQKDDLQRVAIFEESLRTIPVIEQWKWYLFHREKIEELKQKL